MGRQAWFEVNLAGCQSMSCFEHGHSKTSIFALRHERIHRDFTEIWISKNQTGVMKVSRTSETRTAFS
jgi:hypothetical protein